VFPDNLFLQLLTEVNTALSSSVLETHTRGDRIEKWTSKKKAAQVVGGSLGNFALHILCLSSFPAENSEPVP